MQIIEQQKNLQTYLNNINYENKQAKNQLRTIVKDQIINFIHENDSFYIRTGVGKNLDDSFYSYIQIAGYVLIGKELHQMRILFPHNFPSAAPEFHLRYCSDEYLIQNQQYLVTNKIIEIQKISDYEGIIKLRFAFMKTFWVGERKKVIEAFKEMVKMLNNPELLTPNPKYNPYFKKDNELNKTNIFGGAHTEKFMNQIENQVMGLLQKQSEVEKVQRENEYSASRNDFFKRNLPKLSKAMKNYETEVTKNAKQMQFLNGQLFLKNNCDPLLQISQRQNKKIQIISRQEGLKEAEKNLTKCLEKYLSQNTCNFADYKNTIKNLYEKMFQSQLQFLKASE